MTPSRILSRRNFPAVIVGSAVALVVGERLIEAIRPALLLDPEPGWAVVRFFLWIGLLSATAAAGALAAALFLLWMRGPWFPPQPEALPFRRVALVLVAVGSITAGAMLRFVALDRIPASLWIDDVSLVPAALALEGRAGDFADSVRPHPFGVARPFGSVGVLYLELYRLSLAFYGTTVFGVRFLFALAGVLSLVTGALLGRALLPRGGGTLVALILAGLRWHLILSRWSYAIVITPLVDAAALLLLTARRRRSVPAAVMAGIAVGIAAHVYLSAWIAAAALIAFAAWPSPGERVRVRLRVPLLFVAGFLVAVAPLFAFRRGRTAPYFARTADHNVRLEIKRTKSILPPFAAAAEAIVAPWFLSDPIARHDIPGRSRLGLLGIPLALTLARSVVRPREDLSALLLAHGGAVLAANVAGGQADLPNGMRFGYLTSVAAVAVAAGLLSLLNFARSRRREVAIFLVGFIVVASALGARDALVTWAEGRPAFDAFGGQDTLLGRAAARWSRYGRVTMEPGLGHHALTVEGVWQYRLDPAIPHESPAARGRDRAFRVTAPGTAPRSGERLVERVTDTWGREWAWIYGSVSSTGPTRAAA